MKQYLYSVVTLSVVSALFSVFCPDGTSLKKYFSFITSAVLLCATVAPVASFIEGISVGAGLFEKLEQASEESYDAVWKESLEDATKEETERAICAHICEKFDVSEKNVKVDCSFSQEDGGLTLTEIRVTLSSAALMKNPRQIEGYMTESFKVPCTVTDGTVLPSE